MTTSPKLEYLNKIKLYYINKSHVVPDYLLTENADKLVSDVVYSVIIEKAGEAERTVQGFASVSMVDGVPLVDSAGDVISPAELERSVNNFNGGLNNSIIKIDHRGEPVGRITQSIVIDDKILEFCLRRLSPGSQLKEPIKKSCAWYIKAEITDNNAWEKVQSKHFNSFSIGGFAIRQHMSSPEESLERLIQKKIEKMYTSVPGAFVSVNARALTGDVKISVPMKSSVTGQTDPIVTILDVPIAFPAGEKYSVTYPIVKGDQCLLVFSQSELGDWKSSTVSLDKVSGTRRYHISGAIAIPSLYPPIKNKLMHPQGLDTDSINIKGTVKTDGKIFANGSIPVASGDAVYDAINEIMTYLNIMVFFPPVIGVNKQAFIQTATKVYAALAKVKSATIFSSAIPPTPDAPAVPFDITVPTDAEIKQLSEKYKKE